MCFAWRQLQSAIRALAAPADPRDRLHTALGKLVRLKHRDLPAEVARDFSALTGGIARFPLKGINREIKAAVALLNDEEVMDAINSIMRMYDAVAAYQPRPVKHPGGPRRRDALPGPWPVPALHIVATMQAGFFREAA